MHVDKIVHKRQLDLQNDQLGTNLGPTWVQHVPKMEPRRAKMETRRAKLGPSWAKLSQFGPTWVQVGGQVGAKLAQKSIKNGHQNHVENLTKMMQSCARLRGKSGPGVGVPL